MKRNQIIKVFLATPLIFLAVYAIGDIHHNNQKLELKKIQVQSVDLQLKTLQGQYDAALKDAQKGQQTQQQLEQANQRLQDLEKQKQQLEAQLQAKRNSSSATPTAYAASGCGSNQYATYIYMHESGCNPSSVNSIGCRGIGQACPGSKLPCGADFACQDRYFTSYAIARYGGWAGAYAFWVSHHWW